MSRPDSTARAALDAEIIRPVFFTYLDFVGGAVRANTSGVDLAPTGTAYTEINGYNFVGIGGGFLDVSPVQFSPGGSKTVTVTLSGIPTVDDSTLALIDDPANWRGRDAMVWKIVRDANNIQQGGFHRYYTGKMVNVSHSGSTSEQIIKVTIESYLAALSEASNRTYLDQERFDPLDQSARAAVAIANGNYSGSVDGVPDQYVDGSRGFFGDY